MGSIAVISDPSSRTSTQPNLYALLKHRHLYFYKLNSTPTVPEFSNVALISVAAAIVAVTFCTVALTMRTRKPLPR